MTAQIGARPWEALPRELAKVLRPELPGLSAEIVEAISHGVPAYARPLEGPFGRALRTGVEEALDHFVSLVEEPGAGREQGRDVYLGLGRGEMRAGRSLDALLAAYRLGARVAWRCLADAGERAGLEPRTMYQLAEAIFAYIDELSAESIEGYAREQAALAGELQRRRQRLLAMLVQEPAVDPLAVESAATDAAWALPRSLAALALADADPDRLARRLDSDVLVARSGAVTCALVPDPDGPGRRERLGTAISDGRGAIGPIVAWAEAALSFRRARTMLGLATEGALSEVQGLIDAGAHTAELLLGQDRRLAADLRASVLAPLETLTSAQRERMRETLLAWLRHRGRTEQVARSLRVHPQTVRYRLTRLRDLFGDALEEPDSRFELELALRTAPRG